MEEMSIERIKAAFTHDGWHWEDHENEFIVEKPDHMTNLFGPQRLGFTNKDYEYQTRVYCEFLGSEVEVYEQHVSIGGLLSALVSLYTYTDFRSLRRALRPILENLGCIPASEIMLELDNVKAHLTELQDLLARKVTDD